MGYCSTIGIETFPKQTNNVGKCVDVCFNYDKRYRVSGTIIRDDAVLPYETLIDLEDGRIIRGKECEYSFKKVVD